MTNDVIFVDYESEFIYPVLPTSLGGEVKATIEKNGLNQFTYTPIDGFSGIDSMLYIFKNTDQTCPQSADTAVVRVIVRPVVNNDAITATNQNNRYLISIAQLLSNDLGSFLLDSVKILQTNTQKGADISLVNGQLFLDYTDSLINSFSLKSIIDSIQYRSCDLFVCDTAFAAITVDFTRDITVLDNVDEELDVIIQNAISANGDGVGDHLKITFTKTVNGFTREVTPAKTELRIFTKWGDLVYKLDPNDKDGVQYYGETEESLFKGIDLNGKELPSGTYYYMLEYDVDGENRPVSVNGFIVLKR